MENTEDKELMDGLWLFDFESEDLFIIPVPDATREIEGSDTDTLDKLNEFCRNQNGEVTQEQWESLGLEKILDWQKRYDPEAGYYFV